MPHANLRLSIAQMTSWNSHEKNISVLEDLVGKAIADRAQMLALPEAAGLCNRDRGMAQTQVVPEDNDPFLKACCALAMHSNIWIQAGSTPVSGPNEKFLNLATMVSPEGKIFSRYEKIHLFDVFLKGRAATGESTRYDPGSEAVLSETPWGAMGMSVCYDLRFPHMYRDYAKAGAVLSFIPSAFTVPTGRAHWETLLRARAIENGMWIVAAAQVGDHADGRRTWGHSMIINPWGEVIADLGGDEPGLVTVDIDLGAVASARSQIPSIENERPYAFTRIAAN